ncbi:N-6 DNA methylase [Skermanella mucosa]|uniref:restriction endonuclease subunit M n=1 Tax=Skermanella mucosa TaxID=1789672 RepID=UPI00192CC25C|nr:N-6 DNA methylase [Skermanella mucosa]UEM18439.1 N-6 DNA methylase [Skermanella mucosa]
MTPLGAAGIKHVADKILALDPDGKYAKLNTAERNVEYSSEFEFGEAIGDYEGEEEVCRAFIVCWLCTVGGYLPGNIALERRYSIGRPKVGAELDILVRHPDGTPYALIEVKAPGEYEVDQDKFIKGQLFDIAPFEQGASILCFATISIDSAEPLITSKTIDHKIYKKYEDWSISRAASNDIPSNYGEPTHVYLVNGGPRDLRKDVSLIELKRVRKRLHDVLWRGSTPDNTIYAYVVKLFLAKTHDEKTMRPGGKYKFQIGYPGNQRETPSQTFSEINALYKVAYKKYMSLPDDAYVEGLNDREFSHEQTAFVVELIQDISLSKATGGHADILGAFFEGITRDGFKQTKGLFFTHLNVVSFIIHVLDLAGLTKAKICSDRLSSEKLPYVIDPSCGSGTFLLHAMAYITGSIEREREQIEREESDEIRDFIRSHFPVGQENLWAKDFLYGIDYTEVLALSTKVNMLLRRDGQTHIYHADGLAPLSSYNESRLRGKPHDDPSVYSKSVANSFDVVISNPPFSITLDPHTVNSLQSTFELASNSNSENLFLERWYQLLKSRGRLGVVLPESFFSTQENLDARLFLFAHFNVKAVVALPKEAFEPWTPTRTSLLFAEKKTVDEERLWKNRAVKWEARGQKVLSEALRAVAGVLKAASELRSAVEDGSIASLREEVSRVGISLPALSLTECAVDIENVAADWEATTENIKPERNEFEMRDIVKRARACARWMLRRAQSISVGCEILPKANKILGLGNDVPSAEMPLEKIVSIVSQYSPTLKRLDVRVWAFRKIADHFPAPFYVAGADQVGYRRTKRGEAERPNDLFVAYKGTEVPSEGAGERVFDLELCGGQWVIDTSAGVPRNLASQLCKAIAWSNE